MSAFGNFFKFIGKFFIDIFVDEDVICKPYVRKSNKANPKNKNARTASISVAEVSAREKGEKNIKNLVDAIERAVPKGFPKLVKDKFKLNKPITYFLIYMFLKVQRGENNICNVIRLTTNDIYDETGISHYTITKYKKKLVDVGAIEVLSRKCIFVKSVKVLRSLKNSLSNHSTSR